MNADIFKEAVALNAELYDEWCSAKSDRLETIWAEAKAPYAHFFTGRNIGDLVDVGWWPLLLEAFAEIDAIMKTAPGYIFNIVQIKEKFGGLRFYAGVQRVGENEEDEFRESVEDPLRDELYRRTGEIIEQAENKAAVTCEVCSEPGELRGGGWYKTLCDHHHAERVKRDKKRGR